MNYYLLPTITDNALRSFLLFVMILIALVTIAVSTGSYVGVVDPVVLADNLSSFVLGFKYK